MKKTKVIIPALGILLLSTAASVTGTVAWFAANASVSATGMQVKAKTNSTFLLIGESTLTTADQIQAQTGADLISEALTVADNEAAVFPAKAFGVADSSKDPATVADTFEPTAVTTKALASVPGNWYTASSNNPDLWGGTGVTTNPTVLTTFTDYVIKKSVNLTVSDGSVAASNLTVTPTITIKETYNKTTDIALDSNKTYYTLSNDTYTAVAEPNVANIGTYYELATDISAIKVLVVSDNNQVVVLSSTNNGSPVNLYGDSNLSITSTTVHGVDIYIYYDGAEAAVRSTNAVNLSGATIDLVFGVSA